MNSEFREHAAYRLIPPAIVTAAGACSLAAAYAAWRWEQLKGMLPWPAEVPLGSASHTGLAFPLALLAGGLLCTELLASYLLTARRREVAIARELKERVAELKRETAERSLAEQELQAVRLEVELLVRERRADLQASEDSLREYALMWESTFNAMGDGIAIVNADGVIRQCNLGMLEFLAKKEHEVVGSHCWQLLKLSPPLDGRCPIQRAKESGRRETLVVQHAGMWLNLTAEPILDCEGMVCGAVLLIADISGLKEAELELVRVNKTLETVSACNRALVYAKDEQSLLTEVCHSIVDKGGFRFAWVGQAEQDEAKSVRPVASAGHDDGYLQALKVTWDDTGTGRGPCGLAIRTGRSQVCRSTAEDPGFAAWREQALERGYQSAAAFPLTLGKEPFGALAIYAAERHAFSWKEMELLKELAANVAYGMAALRMRRQHSSSEQALKESAELYRTLVENIDAGISLVDEEMTLLAANSHLGRIFEKPVAELIGGKCFDKCGATEPCGECPGRAALETGSQIAVEREQPQPDGGTRLLQIKAFPLAEAEGRSTRFIEVVRDITEQRLAEQEKVNLELQLRHAQKMEALGTLAGGIAHDFNNILTAIDGYCALIGKSADDPQRVSTYLGKLAASSERAAALTRGLLAYSRKQPLNPQSVNLNELVGKLGHMLSRLLGEDIELVTLVAPQPAMVMADPSQLEQVLMNLATNARDAMPRGGILSIATTRIELNADFIKRHGYGKPSTYALLTVSDTGCGMDRRTRERIFEPFFTTKQTGKGTGLGLSIVYGIVKQHNGYVNVYSEPGRGTTFKIYLPLSEQCSPRALPAAVQAAGGGNETLLLVEDDPEIRGTLKELLEQEGYTVIEATDGEQGVARFREYRERIDLLIMDMVMPKMNGRTAYREIDRLSPGIKAIFMSGYTDDILNARGVLEAEDKFLSKPVSIDRLLLKVREVLDYA